MGINRDLKENNYDHIDNMKTVYHSFEIEKLQT